MKSLSIMNFRLLVWRAIKYITYIFIARHKKGHGIHSPFLYDLIINTFNNSFQYETYSRIEKLRKIIRTDRQNYIYTNYRPSQNVYTRHPRKVSDVVKKTAISPKHARLIFRLINKFNPNVSLELGTGVGVTTAYIASAKKHNIVYTVDKNNELTDYARHNLQYLDIENVRIINDTFEEAIKKIIRLNKKIDFLLIDGNHTKTATITYLSQMYSLFHNDTIIIIHDIHWSPEMESAWKTIINNPDIKLAIDLFFMGIIFFKSELNKQNFVIKF